MAEQRTLPPAYSSAAGRARPTRAERARGLWHRPRSLNLIADVMLVCAVAALAWAAVTWVLSRPIFPLRELVLASPPAQTTQAQLEYVARTAIHGNFFTARLEDVRAAFEKLPWVRSAEVRRLWPDGLELTLEEHEAVAYWRDSESGDVRLINAQGEVFMASSDAAMPELSGPRGTATTVLKRFDEYARLLEPLQAKLVRLDLSPRGAWALRLDNGLTVVLGREEERAPLEARLKQFIAAWPRLHGEMGLEVARADLRYPDGFALTPVDKRK
ncbi:MAG: cell division protein FtsQ/DivIB [Azoarcus sp.]|nr:cell division protein FtsQ/DivIB [Azoarcus sp.]